MMDIIKRIPSVLQTEIFLWDSTFHTLFQACLKEIEIRISKKLAAIYLDPSVERTHGYFEFTYLVYDGNKDAQLRHVTIVENTKKDKKYRTYILHDTHTNKEVFVIQYIFIP